MRKFIITSLLIVSSLVLSVVYILNINRLNLPINVTKQDFNEVMIYFVFNDNLTPVSFNVSQDNIVQETFDLLTIRKNSAPLRHLSKIPVNTRLLDYQVIGNNRLVLNVSDHILNTVSHNRSFAMAQLISTYLRQGFSDVLIVNNNQIINI